MNIRPRSGGAIFWQKGGGASYAPPESSRHEAYKDEDCASAALTPPQ